MKALLVRARPVVKWAEEFYGDCCESTWKKMVQLGKDIDEVIV